MIKNHIKDLLLTTVWSLLLTMAICLGQYASAQENTEVKYVANGRALHADDTNVVYGEHGVGWVRSHFFDDWFIQVQGGGQLYYGTDDRLGAFRDRLTGNGEIYIGRRIFPMFGFRVGAGYGYAHGFLRKELYNKYSATILEHGLSGECGTNTDGTPLGGYYWDYNNDLLIQKWKYMYFGGDLLLDLDLFRGTANYTPNKRWNNIVYGGFNTKVALSETDTTNHRTEGHIGYIGKFNITRYFNIYTDIRLSAIERLFDREWVPDIESPSAGVDIIFNVHIGLQYKFHFRNKNERNSFKKSSVEAISKNSDRKNVLTHYIYVTMTDTNRIVIKDTTRIGYKIINLPTRDAQDTIDMLNQDIAWWNNALSTLRSKKPEDTAILSMLMPFEQVFFEKDKWDILPTEEAKIEKMAYIMNLYPDFSFILAGSADSKTGSITRNEILSKERANIIRDTLINHYGIAPERLTCQYRGGILDYLPIQLNRSTIIIMDHPYVKRLFEEIRKKGIAGGGVITIEQ